jgi:hypothetical protein
MAELGEMLEELSGAGASGSFVRAFLHELIDPAEACFAAHRWFVVEFVLTNAGEDCDFEVELLFDAAHVSQDLECVRGQPFHRLTFASSMVPWTVVLARLPSGSERRQEDRDPPLGSLTTTRGLVDDPPVTVVARLEPSAKVVPPSTTWVGTSQTGPDFTLLDIGVAGAHGSG